MLELEIKTFNTIKAELLDQNPDGGFVVIYHETVLGLWPTRSEALEAGIEEYGNIQFLVKDIDERPLTINIMRRNLDRIAKKSPNHWKKRVDYLIENKEWLDVSFDIGLRLCLYRSQNNLSDEDLSKALNCSTEVIDQYLSGQKKLSQSEIDQIEKFIS